MKKVTKIAETAKSKDKLHKIRVAAYCRVSTGSDAQLESLETQKSHYESYIRLHSDWIFAGLYYDEGITGTKKDKRPELMRMISDCEAGKIDYIVTKSISRFSRNTTDCLELVRKLLKLHIPIYFEKENINTATMESELFLSILSSMAESESVSIAENSKWSIQKRFENGTFKISYPPYGYDYDGTNMIVNKQQAAVVKEIFSAVLSGKSCTAIAKDLNKRAVPSKRSGKWNDTTIRNMIANEKYTGDCIFQKTYTDEEFNRHVNHGEKSLYAVHDHHEAIVSHEDAEAARAIVLQHAKEKGLRAETDKYQNRYAFTGKIICGECGSTFKRRIHYCTCSQYVAWTCRTHIEDKTICSMKYIRDDKLKLAFVTMMNKLVFAHRRILLPYVKALQDSPVDSPMRRIQELQTMLAENTEKRETLSRLMAQGIIDQVIYNSENNVLLSEAGKYKREMEALSNSLSSSVGTLTAANDLLHFIGKGVMLDAFDDELFTRHFNQIIVVSREEVSFELKCGLSLHERM
nr:MAG TPA_asm: integrase [Caudoviricetes sp.]